MSKIENLIIHHSASVFGDVGVITEWHKERGWRTIGYNMVILNGRRHSNKPYNLADDGLMEPGRDVNNDLYLQLGEVGAHAAGFNKDSLGICLIGHDKFTPNQFRSLIHYVEYWRSLIPDIKIYGHYHFNKNKPDCPGFNVDKFVNMLDKVDYIGDIRYYFGNLLDIPR